MPNFFQLLSKSDRQELAAFIEECVDRVLRKHSLSIIYHDPNQRCSEVHHGQQCQLNIKHDGVHDFGIRCKSKSIGGLDCGLPASHFGNHQNGYTSWS